MISDINEIQFPKLGWEFHIDPTAFTIFGISIQWYGIIITLGLVLAALYCFPKMKRFGIDSDKAIDVILFGVIGGIIGARAYYVIWKWSDYQRDSFGETLKAIINTRNGGLAIYGGIIGSVLVGYIVCRIKKIKALPMLDITVIGFLIGQGIGRWGNFVNQEAFGTTTDFFLGMTGGRIQQTMGDLTAQPVHPCFLYESAWCLLGFVLLAAYSKRRKYDGQLTLMYLAWYGAERFFVEGMRTDSLMLGSIRISQALSAVLFITSVILQIVIGFRVKRDPESFILYANTEESRLLIEEARRKRMGVKGIDARIEDDSDEIGILPDDDDEIGILPDEEDEQDTEMQDENVDKEDPKESSDSEDNNSENSEEIPNDQKASEIAEESSDDEEKSEDSEEKSDDESNFENSEENPEEDKNKEEK